MAVKSIASDPRHVPTSPFTSYNYHGKGSFASMVDAVVLGATEVDVNFNGNVVTHSDGGCCTASAAGRIAWRRDAPFSRCPRSAIVFR